MNTVLEGVAFFPAVYFIDVKNPIDSLAYIQNRGKLLINRLGMFVQVLQTQVKLAMYPA